MIGQTLLHYRITDRLGAGGMGEVYRATDTNLNRDVAIKVLPPEVAQNAERLGRFRREAQLLAALNHTNIASIHGLEEADGQPFLVLELVEGEDLKQRLEKGAIPLDEALEIARQIAEALEEAHAHGIVHRDLKPANVKLTPDGKVKVLDFGLAKAWAGEAGMGTSSLDLSASPTLARSGTLAGVILGTAAYMSPEQAAGKVVDKRADIWSFGVVLFEMLTGRFLFTGDTASEILASVIKEEPDWKRLPQDMPAGVTRLLRRCLKKKPRERLHDVADARLELEEAVQGVTEGGEGEGRESAAGQNAVRRARTRERLALAAAVVLGAVAALFAWRDLGRHPETPPVVRFRMDAPEALPIRDVAIAVSPDGRHVALTPQPLEQRRLWIRSLDSPQIQAIPGTEGAMAPFWSPDGGAIGFQVLGGGVLTLKRVGLATGAVQTLCSIHSEIWSISSWGRDDTILFGAGSVSAARILAVSAAGGEPTVLLEPDPAAGEGGYWWPQFLPDGRRFLVGVTSAEDQPMGTWMSSLDAPQEKRLVLPEIAFARFSPTGHLLHVRDGTLLAQPFDSARGELTGKASAVISSVGIFSGWPEASIGLLSASVADVLVYAEQGGAGSALAWFDRHGTRVGTVGQPDNYRQIQLSPDGKRAAAQIIHEDGNQDIWTLDLERGVATRATSHPGWDHDAVWSPDGRELFFASDRGEPADGAMRLYRQRLDGSGPASLISGTPTNAWSEDVSPDGQTLIYQTGDSVWAVPLNGDGEPERLMQGDYTFDEPQVSPDGRWLAYGANETGAWEVYVRPFRQDGERVRVSPAGGVQPRWRGDGRELFYVTPEGGLVAVEVTASDGGVRLGLPTELFGGVDSASGYDKYGVTRDGQRFLVITPVKEAGWSLNAILNWPELLQ
jgi:Tol biopolymer transport system component